MSNGIVLCTASHPVDLDDGRVLGPGESATDVDVSHDHNKELLDGGLLIELDSAPKDSPRSADGEAPAPAPAPSAPLVPPVGDTATGGNG